MNPLRRLLEDPFKLLGPFVARGMRVLEPGCGMGFFTLPLARMVGAAGLVVAVDIQPRMLQILGRRAARAKLLERIQLRAASEEGLGVADLAGSMDLVAALHVVHEVPSQGRFFEEIWLALRPGGRLILLEPKGHVSQREFDQTLETAGRVGLVVEPARMRTRGRSALLLKPHGARL